MNGKKTNINIFVDLETAGKKENAAILSIGATDFIRGEKGVFNDEEIKSFRLSMQQKSPTKFEIRSKTIAIQETPDKEIAGHNYSYDATTFYERITLTSCFMRGMSIEEDTQKWWMEQNSEARSELMFQPSKDITNVLQSFIDYCNELTRNGEHELILWSQGTDFDARILGHAIENVLGVPRPWKYNMIRDARTYILENIPSYDDIPPIEGLVKHHALHDAIKGALSVVYTDMVK